MRVVLFYHSLVSCWNHGNAHFLRGVAAELLALGHQVEIFEPAAGWSRANLVADQGERAIKSFADAFPQLTSTVYEPRMLDLDRALDGADLVIVHEWTEPDIVARIGRHRRKTGSYRLLFHDTHHRVASNPRHMSALDLWRYDGALVFGASLAELYRVRGLVDKVWVWHEAADARVFYPRPPSPERRDVVWIGNWGDGERSHQIMSLFVDPVRTLGLRAAAFGVRYPEPAIRKLDEAGIEYCGWLPNHRVPHVLAEFRAAVHIPRAPYTRELAGIPTIRMFEALACGIPVVSAPWLDLEGLFSPGEDFLVAHTSTEMAASLRAIMTDQALANALSERGRATVLARHTCRHRVAELLDIARQIDCRGTFPSPLPALGSRGFPSPRVASRGSSPSSDGAAKAGPESDGPTENPHRRQGD